MRGSAIAHRSRIKSDRRGNAGAHVDVTLSCAVTAEQTRAFAARVPRRVGEEGRGPGVADPRRAWPIQGGVLGVGSASVNVSK